jgi:hypothetical protein
MLTFKQLAQHLERSALRADADLAVVVKAHAEFGAGVARRYIGHLQPSLTVPAPTPAYFPAWEPLAAATVDDKAGLGFGPPDYEPLRRTGEMEESIEGVAAGLTGGIVSTDPKMVHHEFGTAHMPARSTLARALGETMPLLAMGLGMVGMDLLTPRRR